MQVTFAGHSAVFLSVEGSVCAIDPWLRGNPACPAELENPAALDLIVLTHGHADHAGDVLRLHAATGATVACAFELANIFAELGIPRDRLIDMGKGGTVEHGPWKVTLTHAQHSNSFDLPDGTSRYAGEACGAIVRAGDRTVYHAGDTAYFGDMAWIGARYRPDLAFLPIGDRYTMGPEDAVRAAVAIGAGQSVPVHYATFPILTATPDTFLQGCAAAGLRAQALAPGESIAA
ncbi:MAG: metal-dependent hydrolase [Fimbriimonadaceae bacterium]|nr:metal-dependent hydrolase [Fimbriimonadaceae bacterium]